MRDIQEHQPCGGPPVQEHPPVGAFERGTRHDTRLARCGTLIQPGADRAQPGPPVVVGQRHPGRHLGDISGGVERIAVSKSPADARQQRPDRRLSAARHTGHHHNHAVLTIRASGPGATPLSWCPGSRASRRHTAANVMKGLPHRFAVHPDQASDGLRGHASPGPGGRRGRGDVGRLSAAAVGALPSWPAPVVETAYLQDLHAEHLEPGQQAVQRRLIGQLTVHQGFHGSDRGGQAFEVTQGPRREDSGDADLVRGRCHLSSLTTALKGLGGRSGPARAGPAG